MKQSGDWTRTRSLALFHLLECPHILNVRTITTIRLSRLSQRIETSFTPLASRRFPSTLNMHVNTPLCSTIDNLTALQVPLAQLQIMGLGPRSPHYCLRFITLAQALRHPSLYTARDNGPITTIFPDCCIVRSMNRFFE